jgi:hypothetical protein
MASTLTTELGLFKPVPGTDEPFRTTDVNGNWDILDTVVAGYEDRIVTAEESIAGVIEQFEEDGAAAIAAFEVDAAAALALVDTDAIINTIIEDGVSLDVDGGSA